MSGSRKWLSLAWWGRKVRGEGNAVKKAPEPHLTKAAKAPKAPEDEAAVVKRLTPVAVKLGLEAGPAGLTYRETRAFSDRGVALDLLTSTAYPYHPADFRRPELADPEGVKLWLTKLRDDLAGNARVALEQSQAALKGLIDLVLDPAEQRWLNLDEAAARRTYLAFPPSPLPAHEALALAKRRAKELHAAAGKARLGVVEGRMKRLGLARLQGRTMQRRFIENLPFLTSVLELELNIEASLENRDLDRLANDPDEQLQATLDALLTRPRQALVAKLNEQLKELARRIKALPHIELLPDADIASTVAPYYGGLNRDLKKRRARSALVAVEERAREAKYQDDVIKLNEQRGAYADVASYYPVARTMKRELVLYVGPTNSGKTWRSLNELAAAGSGAYLAPLRLLALEGQEELEKRGKPTSFVTGEERDLRPDAQFVSSTIEMLNVELPVEAVVVDEVQLLVDERRGWAWLAAVVGAPAKKVIMTGSPDCVEIVKDLAKYLNEPLTIHECQRYNELRVADEPMRLRDIRPGTAIVCFSRRDVLRIKATIQENSDLKVAVVYGNLSPQVRREEARRFRDGEASILVATDAIAMGLNLPIMEVVFYTTEKFNGEEMVPLTSSEIRQIGGRAGRYGFAQFGVVNALNQKSLDQIRDALKETPEILKPPYFVAPGRNHVRIISEVLGTTSLERILTFFDRAIEFSDDRFARSNIDDLSYLSTFVDDRLPFLDVTERLTIASAPVAIRNDTVVQWFLNRMLRCFKDPENPARWDEDLDDLFDAARHFDRDAARSPLELRDAEDYLKTLTVYAWLAYRYPDVFTRVDECEDRREAVNAYVERSLRGTMKKKCATCGVDLPGAFAFKVCEGCHAQKKGGDHREGGGARRRGGGHRKRG